MAMPRKKKKGARKTLIKACDKLWAEAVTKRDKGICQRCGKPGKQNHHIFSRRYLNVRHCLDNGIHLCGGCHIFFAHVEVEAFRDFIIKRMGQREYDSLKVRAMAKSYIDFEMRRIELKEYLKTSGDG